MSRPPSLGLAGRIAHTFVDSRLTPLFVIASVLAGVFAVALLPREEEPQIKVPMIDVLVAMPGFSAEEVEQRATRPMEKLLWEIPGVEVEARALEAHRERLAAELPFFDLEISRADERGARQFHIVSGQSRFDADGNFVGYRGVGRDVTEQRGAERALLRADERLELALDGGNLAEFHFDPARGELSAGDGWVRFLGHTTSPAVTLGAELIAMMHPDDRIAYTEALVSALRGEAEAFDTEFRIRARDGAWKWLHARGRVTERGADGRAKRMSGTVADIEDRKSVV